MALLGVRELSRTDLKRKVKKKLTALWRVCVLLKLAFLCKENNNLLFVIAAESAAKYYLVKERNKNKTLRVYKNKR